MFGLSVFIGATFGYAESFFIMPLFYDVQNADSILPEIKIAFHPILMLCMIMIPAIMSFCFSAMTQMSVGVKDLSSTMMSVMVLAIGIVLAIVTLILAVSTVVNGNRKTIAMMRIFGYSQKIYKHAILFCGCSQGKSLS